MKKILFASLVVATACATSYGQAQRRVLFEQFTQASCGPCAAQNPAFNTLIGAAPANANTPKVVGLKYQVWWPGYDPMYEQNTADVDNRVGYYDVQGVPDVMMDGNVLANVAPNTITQTTIDNQYAVTSPIELHLTHDWTPNADSVIINVKVKNVSASAFGTTTHRLHVALVEKDIIFATAPGSNGETEFHGVMRKMIPSANGATFSAIPAGDSLEVTYTVAVPNYIYNLNEIAVAAFVQDNSDKNVENAQWSDPVALPASLPLLDISAASATVAPVGYCNYDVTPEIEVTNEAATALESFKAYYAINGGTPVSMDVTGINVANGQTYTVTFAQTTLTPGVANVSYWVNSWNYNTTPAVDPNLSDNAIADETFASLSAASVGTDIQEGFENNGTGDAAPDNAILDNPGGHDVFVISGDDAGLTDLGGFGLSNICYMWDYYLIEAGLPAATLIFDKVDVTAFNVPELAFDHAYAQYSNENDRLEVRVSTDCGNTWTTLFNKAGTALSTAPANGSARFFPTATQWAANTIDLSAYATATELVVAFKGTSAYGNNLYVDNVNIQETPVGTETVAPVAASMNLFPNPVRNELNVKFELTETTDLNVVIYNALGQQIRSVANGSFNGENIVTVNTTDLAAGVYHVNLVSKEGVMTQRFVVEK